MCNFCLFRFILTIFLRQRHLWISQIKSKLSGPFGDELIAGSYLQRFCLFLFFLALFYKNYFTKINLNFLFLMTFILLFFSIVIAGNRMSVVLFMLLFIFLFLLEKNLRKFLIILIPFIFILYFAFYNFFPYIEYLTNQFLSILIKLFFL